MLKSFNIPRKIDFSGIQIRDPRVAMRALLGVLLLANVVTAVIAFQPFGGSAEDLRRDEQALHRQLQELEMRNARSKALVDKVRQARSEGEQFLAKYVTDRRTTFSIMVEEMNRAAKEAGIKPGSASWVLDPIEGSETLHMMSITAGFEGTYANLTKFINLLDKSPRFLIIESMVAAPQQGGQNLNVSIKLDTFVRDTENSL